MTALKFYGDGRAVIVDPQQDGLKRIAYAYGIAKPGSDEERQLLAVLVERIQGGTK